MDVVQQIELLLTGIGRQGAVCVLDVHSSAEIALNAHQVVQTGSAFKIAVCLEVYSQAASNELGLKEPLHFRAERADVSDPSVKDAVGLMMRLSDNAATGALIRRVGRGRIVARLHGLGLSNTTIGDPDVVADVGRIVRELDRLARRAGFREWAETARLVAGRKYDEVAARLAAMSVDEETLPHTMLGPTTTARELASLYAMIWRDEAASPRVCAAVRRAAGHQALQRLQLGFAAEPGVTVAGKGGSIPGVVNNDAGVVTFPDGRSYAMAVFTRAVHAFDGERDTTRMIGSIAQLAAAALLNQA